MFVLSRRLKQVHWFMALFFIIYLSPGTTLGTSLRKSSADGRHDGLTWVAFSLESLHLHLPRLLYSFIDLLLQPPPPTFAKLYPRVRFPPLGRLTTLWRIIAMICVSDLSQLTRSPQESLCYAIHDSSKGPQHNYPPCVSTTHYDLQSPQHPLKHGLRHPCPLSSPAARLSRFLARAGVGCFNLDTDIILTLQLISTTNYRCCLRLAFAKHPSKLNGATPCRENRKKTQKKEENENEKR